MTACVTIPATFEQNLSLGNGDVGSSLDQALHLDQKSVPNLYSINGDQFSFSFQEYGVAYNETVATGSTAQAAFTIQPGSSQGFTLEVDTSPVEKWGINFAGRVIVRQRTGDERLIYLPGTRTYDPAGLTGVCAWLNVVCLNFLFDWFWSKGLCFRLLVGEQQLQQSYLLVS